MVPPFRVCAPEALIVLFVVPAVCVNVPVLSTAEPASVPLFVTDATVSAVVSIVRTPALVTAAVVSRPPPVLVSEPDPLMDTVSDAIVPDSRTEPPTLTAPSPESAPEIVPPVSD